MNKNLLTNIYYKPGFRNLKSLSFEDNLISTWESFDALNEFDSRIQEIRVAGNPLFKSHEKNDNQIIDMSREFEEEVNKAKCIAISKLEFLKKYNGTKISENERKDVELFYMKYTLETYLKEVLVVEEEKDRKLDDLDEPNF